MAGEQLHVTVVTAPGCHLCDDALDVLTGLSADFPIEVTSLDARSAEGGRLLREHRAAMNPLVLVDGTFFSSGRLPRGKVHALLAARTDLTPKGTRHG